MPSWLVLFAELRHRSLREVFQETLERIHLQFGTLLREFDGDAAALQRNEPLLEDCLKSGYDLDQTGEIEAARSLHFG